MLQLEHLINNGRHVELLALLRDVGAMVRDFVDIFKNNIAAVDVSIFYDVYRHSLNGWWDTPIFLAGVEPPQRRGQGKLDDDDEVLAAAAAARTAEGKGAEAGHFVRAKGPSAGQSTMIMLLDLALDIR